LKILVPLKRVPDPDTRIRVKPDGSAVDLDGVKFAVNPFDSIALEEALRIKEKIGEAEVVVATVGGQDCVEQLRVGLAMGADRALLIRSTDDLDALAIAKVLVAIYRREQPAFVLMGKQAIDDDSNQVGQMLAALLGIGQATFVSKLELTENNS
jgi:electron transfer flavoprotein beta subunit